jgi:hypothetical protein
LFQQTIRFTQLCTYCSTGSKKSFCQDRSSALVRPDRTHAMRLFTQHDAVAVTVEGSTSLPETRMVNKRRQVLRFSDRNIRRVTLISKNAISRRTTLRVTGCRLLL